MLILLKYFFLVSLRSLYFEYFVISCCKFLKFIILKTFNEVVLAFLSVESKTNKVYVIMNFTGNLILGFGRHCGKVFPETAVFYLFE